LGKIDVAITSPPYEDTMGEKRHASPNTGSAEKIVKEKHLGWYPTTPSNIGSMKRETYLEAMFRVYSEMYAVLKEGGRAIIVVKPFQRQGRVIDLPYQTWLLLEKIGFQLEDVLKLRLDKLSFWRILQYKKRPEVPRIMHEYILVCKKP
jgi:DNA modification methylase